MIKKKQQRLVSLWLSILMVLSVFTGFVPAVAAQTSSGPVVHENGSVTFTYEGTAERVRVAGSFTDWESGALEMQQQDGVWTLTTNPLTPDDYQYKFILGESNWINDPSNPQTASGNSRLVVSGINLQPVANLLEAGSTTNLKANFISPAGTVTEEAGSVTWSVDNAPAGVAVDGSTLTIASSVAVGSTFTVKAEKDGYVATKEITVSAQMFRYTVNYHRTDNNLDGWNLWIYNGGFPSAAYNFTSTNTVTADGQDFTFATGTFAFPENDFTVIPRKGNWESQDTDRVVRMPDGQMNTEVWIVQGFSEVFTSENDAIRALTGSVPPHIRFLYERPDADYTNWDVWVWGTGAQDNNHDFVKFEDGKAIAEIAVGPIAQRVGFIVRQIGWTGREPGGDRFITVNTTDPITKVHVVSGQTVFHTVPAVRAPEVNSGNATFHFRDKELYLDDAMHTIEKVELSILGEHHAMTYEEANERFVFTYEDLPFGDHEYSFFVTINGVTTEVQDQYFSGTISYFQPEIEITGTVFPAEIDYNQNAVLTLDIVNEDEAEIRGLYVDLTEVGGNERVFIDPQLEEITIAVHHATTAGVKTLPLIAIDAYGNEHRGEAEVTVKARQFVGEADFDWDEAIIYFMLTDRFFNGDESNDDPYGVGYDKNDPGAYQGGDFKGITEKMDYLYELGINTIWINPIVENIVYDVRHNDNPHVTPYYGYHGYWASNFDELNPHFGTMEDFHEMIDAAHDRGIKIMIDVVLNHSGYGLKAADAVHYGTIPHFPTHEDRARFDGMLRDGGNDTVRGELAGLPDFITEDPAVRDQIVEWQTQWIEKSRTPNGNTIDYFRVDTVKHVEDTTWMAFKNAQTKVMPEFKMIGESWGASQSDDHGYLRTGMMDSLLDFNFKNVARDLVQGRINRVENYMSDRNGVIDNTATLGQFISSHDEPRFLSFINDEGNLGAQMLAGSLMVTGKGQPVLYYGDELGLVGRDNYPLYTNRQNFPWDEVEGNPVHDHFTRILNARKDYSQVFAKGTRERVAGGDAEGYTVFARSFNGETVIVGINTREQAAQVTFQVPFAVGEEVVNVYSGEKVIVNSDQTVTVTLPGVQAGGTFILATPLVETPVDADLGQDPAPATVVVDQGVSTPVAANEVVQVKDTKASITMPANLPANTTIAVELVEEPANTRNLVKAGEVIKVNLDVPGGFEGLEFELVLGFDEQYENVAIYYYNEELGEWELKGGDIDSTTNTIRLVVNHFSTYGVFEVEQTIEAPIIEEPVVENPVIEEPVTDEPVVDEAVDEEPTVEEPATDSPVEGPTVQPVTEEVELENPVTEEPTTNAPVIEENGSSETVEESVSEEKELPDTATTLYNYLLVGALLLLVGATIVVFQRKKAYQK
ncbi:MAG: LPXTG cell wall anchor domain-containing protein [Bacillaceae bacterium]|nr:LPXTG cell wall anchor domain-containing protein [Bacillaceae bacterium]